MRTLTIDSLNPAIRNVEYAVRGELAIKAEEYRVRLQKPNHGLPFDRVISSNIGNPQQKGLDQPPITWNRQIAALTEYPELIEKARNLFPEDAIERAKELLEEVGSIGAYSHSQGIPPIRQNVANFIAARDGFPSNPDHIFLTAGASAGVSLLLSMLIAKPNKSGVLIPIPQYPLYTATLAQYSGVPVPYHLDEESGWSTSPQHIREALSKAQSEGIDVRALVVINPGNPTGSLLTSAVQRELVSICNEHGLVLFADEVYQENLHYRDSTPFTSFKKILCEMTKSDPKIDVALASFHSTSKGVTGECGRRGGYFELVNVPSSIISEIYKMASVGLCPPVPGQIAVDCMVRPPQPGSPSYALWKKETDAIHAALAHRTRTMVEKLNALPGMSCQSASGALYLYPRVSLPANAIAAAHKAGKKADTFYALALLDATGICAVSGSGFGQRGDEANFRLTCLCAGVEEYIGKLEKFHREFMEKYS
ncbi:transaminase [Fomitiporia mediterranea MF3/22]|uniref:transaminase n=1 Tax=Fomitiporia mediterranea (strain MF3/22) TaxID=694068 RepID=UPI000440805F|nr:transaminase [Fomitiporia mediterranea MF3/22]EJD05316.1 transaminase [Fomitiporia mediterranea MF3/22]